MAILNEVSGSYSNMANSYVNDNSNNAEAAAIVPLTQGKEPEPEKVQGEVKPKLQDVSINKTSKDVNKILNDNTVAEYGYNDKTNTITIKLKDKNTNEVLKEIPSDKIMKIIEKSLELAGIIVDEKR